VNSAVLKATGNPAVKFRTACPAWLEVTGEVFPSPASVVFDDVPGRVDGTHGRSVHPLRAGNRPGGRDRRADRRRAHPGRPGRYHYQSVTKSGRFTTMSTQLPDQAGFRPILPEGIDWEPFPAFPPAARLAVVVGQPAEPAPYVVRVKLPSGVKLMPHRHHEDRVYTVISGVFYIGLGEQFDDGKLQAYPPGAVIVLPAGTPHFHWARSGEYVTQVTAIGPISLEYLDPADDPRNKTGISG
jgi:quercetin dioxygenase-like cupin family protein